MNFWQASQRSHEQQEVMHANASPLGRRSTRLRPEKRYLGIETIDIDGWLKYEGTANFITQLSGSNDQGKRDSLNN